MIHRLSFCNRFDQKKDARTYRNCVQTDKNMKANMCRTQCKNQPNLRQKKPQDIMLNKVKVDKACKKKRKDWARRHKARWRQRMILSRARDKDRIHVVQIDFSRFLDLIQISDCTSCSKFISKMLLPAVLCYSYRY
jgi:hypothetical protein